MTSGLMLSHKFPVLQPVVRWTNNFLTTRAYRTYQKHGEKGWEKFWIPAMKEFGRVRAPHLAKVMNIDPNNAKSIGQYHDFEDPIFGVVGHWEKNDEGHDVRVETECGICDHLEKVTDGKQCPAFCRKVVTAMEMGTGQAINENYVVEIDSLLTDGDKDCRFIHRIQ